VQAEASSLSGCAAGVATAQDGTADHNNPYYYPSRFAFGTIMDCSLWQLFRRGESAATTHPHATTSTSHALRRLNVVIF